jgi:hypothetical protein
MTTVTNPLQACNDVFFRPGSVFEALKQHNNWSWLPFFIVVVMAVLPNYLYFTTIDPVWYVEHLLANSLDFADLSPAELDGMRDLIPVESMGTWGALGGLVGLTIINAIIAVYFNLVTKSDEENLNGFTDWYGATWWMGMPVVIGSLISIVMILLSNDGTNQMPLSIVSSTSLAHIFGLDISSTWFGLANAFRLESLLSIYIGAAAIGSWTNFAWNKSLLLSALPTIIIYSIWAVVIVIG